MHKVRTSAVQNLEPLRWFMLCTNQQFPVCHFVLWHEGVTLYSVTRRAGSFHGRNEIGARPCGSEVCGQSFLQATHLCINVFIVKTGTLFHLNEGFYVLIFWTHANTHFSQPSIWLKFQMWRAHLKWFAPNTTHTINISKNRTEQEAEKEQKELGIKLAACM